MSECDVRVAVSEEERAKGVATAATANLDRAGGKASDHYMSLRPVTVIEIIRGR